MSTIFHFIRIVIAIALAIGAMGLSTVGALADQPTKTDISGTAFYTLTEVCAFDVTITSVFSGFFTDFYDNNGALTREFVHIVEQDTFDANGKTLVGDAFTFNIEWLFDSEGNVTNIIATGVTEKIPLPDGSLFISAGWVDFTNHPGVNFVLSPDKGNPGDVEGFCAALAP